MVTVGLAERKQQEWLLEFESRLVIVMRRSLQMVTLAALAVATAFDPLRPFSTMKRYDSGSEVVGHLLTHV